MSDRIVEISAVTPADLAACRDIFFASYNDLHRRYGQEEEDPADHGWLDGALAHILETDPKATVLALADGAPCGFASSYRRDGFWFLSFLFVLPDRQTAGVGRALLDAVMPADEITRALVVESFQPASTGLYASYGITPRSVRYGLTGPTNTAALPELPAVVRAEPLHADGVPGLEEIDRQHLGYSRPQDHRWWLAGMRGWVYRRGDEIVGYGYLDADGRVGPALGSDQETVCAVMADLVMRLDDPSAAWIALRGETSNLFRTFVRAGARIRPSGYLYLYCSSGGPLPSTYVDFAGYMP